MYKNLEEKDLAYLAGFIEGDGCFLTQIVKGSTYKYKFTIRISVVFYQKKQNHWFFLWLKKLLGFGYIRDRKDGMLEYVITGIKPVQNLILLLKPYLKLKLSLAKLVLKIIENLENVKTEADFLEVCRLVDETAKYTYSKKRIITSVFVEEFLKLPVETEKS